MCRARRLFDAHRLTVKKEIGEKEQEKRREKRRKIDPSTIQREIDSRHESRERGNNTHVPFYLHSHSTRLAPHRGSPSRSNSQARADSTRPHTRLDCALEYHSTQQLNSNRRKTATRTATKEGRTAPLCCRHPSAAHSGRSRPTVISSSPPTHFTPLCE